MNPSTHSTRLRAGFAQDRFGWVNEPHVKRGAKRNGGPAYVGAFCFDSSLPLSLAMIPLEYKALQRGKPPRVGRKISHPPCLLSNLELDYESMEKAEIKRKTGIYARCHYGP